MKFHVVSIYRYDGGSVVSFETREEAVAYAEKWGTQAYEWYIIEGAIVKEG